MKRERTRKQYSLDIIESNIQTLKKYVPYSQIEYAFILLWNDQLTSQSLFFLDESEKLKQLLHDSNEDKVGNILTSIVDYLNLLIAKEQYNLAISLFENDNGLELKQVVKPVYYALMNYMKKEFPREYLKAGEELKETIGEIIDVIENIKRNIYKKRR
ncbi:MAG: hypothetical protein WDO19_20200 [Bacteroidota bacterium]